ncbi:signal peptidase I [Pseudodesulfovibrio sp. zrk46]|nr:signal peptidase I [Pseudodesulfovibrio sp. zrk46]
MNQGWVYALVLLLNFTVGTAVEVVFAKRFNKNFKVPSESMIPTLVVGDHFMAQMLDDNAIIKRGEVVVFDDPKSGRHFVKRVVGLPGETLEIRNHMVYINGKALDEPHAVHIRDALEPNQANFGPYHMKAEEYFMMGDNREHSYDSRWIGAIKRDKIRGRAKYIYFPGNIGGAHWYDRLGSTIR